MGEKQYDFGMVGLGTMGRNLVYNMCDHGYSVAGFDKDAAQVANFVKEGQGKNILGTSDLAEYITALKAPRVVLLLVPAGPVVDAVVNELKPYLSKDDLILDCGNSHFTDTDRRISELEKDNLHFMGVGVSGGEEGARFGPSIMPGGPKDIYARVSPMLEAISAKAHGEPCVTYLGPGSSGHYVKMVHNGIEYGLMQLISEAYIMLKEGAGLTNDEMQAVFAKWNTGKLQSFLIEITAEIFAKQDDLTGNRLIDMIMDGAHQKGTGKWASQNAMDLQFPIPLIDTAVAARELSAYKEERIAAEKILHGPGETIDMDKKALTDALEQALYFSMITAYAQGMSLMQQASKEYKYDLKMQDIAAIWRGGCIIRAGLLEHIRTAYTMDSTLPNILPDSFFAKELKDAQAGMRHVVRTAAESGIPVPAMMSSLSYYDSYRRGWLPANLIQAQRDFFGAHTYERTDRKGTFHTQWNQKK